MNKNPIYIVVDDIDDHEFLRESWIELGYENELIFFRDAEAVMNKLRDKTVIPFLIICDVNLPKVGGFELKAKLLEDETLNSKSIPFIFWSTEASDQQIKKAYDLGGNGFFIKGNTINELKQTLEQIVNYWENSKQPRI